MRIAPALALVLAAVAAVPALAQDLPAGTDPVFAEAFEACFSGTGAGVPPGWTTHDSGDVDAQAWDMWTRIFATKEIDGVGGMNLSGVVEKYPGYELGRCDLTIEEPQVEIAAPTLKGAPGWTGTLQGDAADWSGLWRNDAGTIFVRGLYSEGRLFRLSMTTLDVSP